MSDENKSLDILGVKPIADSVSTVTTAGVDGASAFLSRICLPAAEEFGLLLRDKVSSWRAKNAVNIVEKAQELLEKQIGTVVLHSHPRIIFSALENGSWSEDHYMQSLWSGLLVSSCSQNGKDESNLKFIQLLSQLTTGQGKIIKYACENAIITVTSVGLAIPKPYSAILLDVNELIEIMEITDVHEIDCELDHLRSLELIEVGFDPDGEKANVVPTAFCLQFYSRCQGFRGSPIDYYRNQIEAHPNDL